MICKYCGLPIQVSKYKDGAAISHYFHIPSGYFFCNLANGDSNIPCGTEAKPFDFKEYSVLVKQL